MEVISKVNDVGLTAGKKYRVIEESAGYYKVELDNGNVSYRYSGLFDREEKEK